MLGSRLYRYRLVQKQRWEHPFQVEILRHGAYSFSSCSASKGSEGNI